MADDSKLIAIDQVKIGMFIKLDLSWLEHSFATGAFKITKQQQIQELLALNLKHIRYFPSKSDLALIQATATPVTPSAVLPQSSQIKIYGSVIEAKRARLEKLKQQREEIARCEEKFVHAATVVRSIGTSIFHSPAETLKEAGKLVDSIAETFLNEDDTIMHLMQQAAGNEEVYFHALNVAVLAMMIAHNMKCTEAQIKSVGMAGLFHDLGKIEIPDSILKKTEKFSTPEQNLFEMHPQYGMDIGKKAGMPDIVLEVIANHHELMDGSGYPNKIKGDLIRLPTRIVTIANVYDNLCNHIDPRMSLTPHEALSTMYAHRRAQFDPAILATIIKTLGVYPPGTLVRLSNEAIGLVVNVNAGKPLRPCVLIYDEEIPKEDAIIIDLSEESSDLGISASIRPGLLPRVILEYLNPRKRINYYVASSDSKKKASPDSGKGLVERNRPKS